MYQTKTENGAGDFAAEQQETDAYLRKVFFETNVNGHYLFAVQISGEGCMQNYRHLAEMGRHLQF